ncbi:MAG: citrate synthase [Lachnospiraceae bacterium]|nr:citrate synthase [Lachnospiraceae bacterium]
MSNTSDTMDKIRHLVTVSRETTKFDPRLYYEYNVNQGLRTASGRGVRTGLTEISDVKGYVTDDGERQHAPGTLFYQGYDIKDLIHGLKGRRYGFEEITYLLLFGELPTQMQLEDFVQAMSFLQNLPISFTRDVIMKAQSDNLMNSLQKCVLTLYAYDPNPEDTSIHNVVRQCLDLIAKLPLLTAYSFFSYGYYHKGDNLFLRHPKQELSFAENVLQMLNSDGNFTDLEARMLDLMLILHAEHGGGTNSTFVTHVISSSGTDTYSSIAASLGALKGSRHGGVDRRAEEMIRDIMANVKDLSDEEELRMYIRRIMDGEVGDKTGNIYGIGHAIYTYSDPRAELIKELLPALAEEKGQTPMLEFLFRLERIILDVMPKKRRLEKPVCATMDFYAGFVYQLLGISGDLYTPLYAMGRVSGWSAHRIEELANSSKIIRPAYKYVGQHKVYSPIEKRK